MGRRRKSGRSKKPKKSVGRRHIIAEIKTRVKGKPAVIRVYDKVEGKTSYSATVRVGTTKMGDKPPRYGMKIVKKKKKK